MTEAAKTKMTAAAFARLPETTTPTELIHGEVIVSPSPRATHQVIVVGLIVILNEVATKGQVNVSPLDVYLDEHNVVQPDVFWVSAGSTTCALGEDDYWHGGPDLVVEVISPGSTRRDKVTKFRLYEAHGVREYWLVDPEAGALEVWVRGEDDLFARQGLYTETFTSPVLGGVAVDIKDLWP
ncbi:MAG: Uma2 family endonuclease [Chloroflexi bacterium]|nr:Uma2 family endonuclease [Chloroflexota bacterium]